MNSKLRKGVIYPFQIKELSPLRPREMEKPGLGLVIDLGTSTVALYPIDLQNGTLLEKSYFSNPGAKYGADVLNRVKAVIEEPSNLDKISGDLLREINSNINELALKENFCSDDILGITVIGNPIMIHLFYRIDPTPLSKSPFELVFKGDKVSLAGDLGILANPLALVATPPLVSAFIGSDTLCAILSAWEMAFPSPFFLLDLGTNAEIALVKEEKVFAASAAAGPAFEDFDFPLEEVLEYGFLKNLDFSPEVGLKMIFEGSPQRILASAKIDALAILKNTGALDQSGLLKPSKSTPQEISARIFQDEEGRSFFQIAPNLLLSQEDIRQLQLAKSAIQTAIKFLIEASGINISTIQALLLCGTFGTMIRPESAESIGLIPKGLSGKTFSVGNMAGRGGILFLLSSSMRALSCEIKEKIQVIRLTKNPKFQDVFFKSLEFPS